MGQKGSKPQSSNSSNSRNRSHSPVMNQQVMNQQVQIQQKPANQEEVVITDLPSSLIANIQDQLKLEDPIQDYVKQTSNQPLDLKKMIKVSAVSEYSSFRLSSSKSQTFPVMISLDTKGLEVQVDRAPIDIVCVIDDSGSMSGKKADLVRNSLRYLLKILNEKDRICLVSFDSDAKILVPFLSASLENKDRIKTGIKEIRGRGGTEIHKGMENALWMLQNRKQKNPVSCIFLLTDGQDNNMNADGRVKFLMNKYKMPEKYTINCYGYGNDHDADVLSKISKAGEGGFYYIEDLKQIQDYFILSMSGLLNVLAQEVKIMVTDCNQFSIVKRYGDSNVWSKDNIIQIPMLVLGERKDYFVEVEQAKSKKKVTDLQRATQVVKVSLTAKDLQNVPFTIETELIQTAYNEDEELLLVKDENKEFQIGYLRSKGGVVIGEACELAKQQKYDEGQKMLKSMLEEIDASPHKETRSLQSLRGDILKSLEVCKPRVFEEKGKAFMYKKNQDHVERRASICNMDDWNDQQVEQLDMYKNGQMNLSCSSGGEDNNDDDYSPGIQRKGSFIRNQSFSDEEGLPQQQLQYSPGLQKPVRKDSGKLSDIASESDDNEQKRQQKVQKVASMKVNPTKNKQAGFLEDQEEEQKVN